jgi:hypothetical protein
VLIKSEKIMLGKHSWLQFDGFLTFTIPALYFVVVGSTPGNGKGPNRL